MLDPSIGRWMQEDPIWPEDGVNPYAYVGNNPTNATDPSGLRAQKMDPLSEQTNYLKEKLLARRASSDQAQAQLSLTGAMAELLNGAFKPVFPEWRVDDPNLGKRTAHAVEGGVYHRHLANVLEVRKPEDLVALRKKWEHERSEADKAASEATARYQVDRIFEGMPRQVRDIAKPTNSVLELARSVLHRTEAAAIHQDLADLMVVLTRLKLIDE